MGVVRQIGMIQFSPARARWCWGWIRRWGWIGLWWCGINDHAHGQARRVIPVAVLQGLHHGPRQAGVQASPPRIATAIRAIAAQVSALQAQPPIILPTIPDHQLVG